MTATDVPLDDDGKPLDQNVYDVLDENGTPVPLADEPPPYLRFAKVPST